MITTREDKIKFICSIANKPEEDTRKWSDEEVDLTYDRFIQLLNHMG